MSKRRFGATASILSVGGQTFREAPIVLRRQTGTTMATITGVRMTHGLSVTLSEPAIGSRQEIRTVAMHIRLLGSYHDGHIELRYPRVFRYQLHLDSGVDGHRDWCYDEFRLTDDGNLLHEIEWSGRGAIAL